MKRQMSCFLQIMPRRLVNVVCKRVRASVLKFRQALFIIIPAYESDCQTAYRQ